MVSAVRRSRPARLSAPHRSRAANWVELLAATRPVSFGAFSRAGQGEPRNGGFAFNWARSDAPSDEMVRYQLPGLVGTYGRQYYVDYPQSSPVVRFVMISPNMSFNGATPWDFSEF